MFEGEGGAGGAGGDGGQQQQQQQAAWHAGFDPDTTAYIQAKKLDGITDIREAFANVAKFHREAESFLGVPKDQLLRRPNPTDTASQKAFWQQFGVPEKPEDYDFSQVKFSDNSDLDPEFANTIRATAFEHNIPPSAAQAFAKAMAAHAEKVDAAEAQENAAALASQQAALKAAWGAAYDSNLAAANRTAAALGIGADQVQALVGLVGGDKVLQMFHKISTVTREDSFVGGSPNIGGDAPVGVEDAKAQLEMLQNDREWVAKFNAGDFAAKQMWQKLHRAANPAVYEAAGI